MKAILTRWSNAWRAALIKILTLPNAEVSQATIKPTWHPVLGDTIELGSTGFKIALEPKLGCPSFNLYSPEGELIARHANMAMLKEYGEANAAWRAEFLVTPERCSELKAVLARQAKEAQS